MLSSPEYCFYIILLLVILFSTEIIQMVHKERAEQFREKKYLYIISLIIGGKINHKTFIALFTYNIVVTLV